MSSDRASDSASGTASGGGRRELLVTLAATPTAGPAERHGPERRLLADAAMLDRQSGRWELDLGTLDDETAERLELLLRARREHGTALNLEVRVAPGDWYGTTLPWPMPDEHGYRIGERDDPDGVHTLLMIDVQYLDGGPIHHWWLAAEPPRGTHPDPDAACRVLRELDESDHNPFEPSTGASAQMWGGPGNATVRGFWRGRWVHAELNKADSGETGRWNRLGAVLRPGRVDQPTRDD